MSNRSDRRKSTVTRIDRDKPDLTGVDLSSKAVRYILTTVTVPDALGPEQVTQGMIDTLNQETRKSPPWLKMVSFQVYPGDIVAPSTLDIEALRVRLDELEAALDRVEGEVSK